VVDREHQDLKVQSRVVLLTIVAARQRPRAHACVHEKFSSFLRRFFSSPKASFFGLGGGCTSTSQ
jgi:hypothetical protein